MEVTLTLSRWYGCVICGVVMNWMVLFWQMLQVGKARKKFGVKYPTLYESKEDSEYNLIQRAHQSSLEWNPSFITFLLISGIFTPIFSSIAAVVYNVSRVYHAKGYYKGSAHRGLWGLYGLFYLLFGSMYTAYKLLFSL